MAFLDIIHRLLRNSDVPLDSRVERAEVLRERLSYDPNDIPAFEELAQIVRDVYERREPSDPLRAETTGSIEFTADLALWALAEEVGASPDAWYPLVALARLSVDADRETAMRRLAVATDRDNTGRALAAGIRVLREAGLPSAGIGLGLGRWRPENQIFEAGEQLVLAALDAGRVSEAEEFLSKLPTAEHSNQIESLRSAIRYVEER